MECHPNHWDSHSIMKKKITREVTSPVSLWRSVSLVVVVGVCGAVVAGVRPGPGGLMCLGHCRPHDITC